MNRKMQFRRRQVFLVDSSQPRILAGIELTFLFLLIVSGAVFLLVANRDLRTSYLSAHLSIQNVQEILLPSLALINLGGMVTSAILLVFFTHRIVGPVYRLRQIMREIGRGNLAQTVHFRDGDELKELEQTGAEMLAGLNQRVFSIKVLAEQVRMETNVLRACHPELGRETENLDCTTRLLAEQTSDFRLHSDWVKGASPTT